VLLGSRISLKQAYNVEENSLSYWFDVFFPRHFAIARNYSMKSNHKERNGLQKIRLVKGSFKIALRLVVVHNK
jgi:hypothetical protein